MHTRFKSVSSWVKDEHIYSHHQAGDIHFLLTSLEEVAITATRTHTSTHKYHEINVRANMQTTSFLYFL